jgi:hypothetical protein
MLIAVLLLVWLAVAAFAAQRMVYTAERSAPRQRRTATVG